jgi:hypothetical protein
MISRHNHSEYRYKKLKRYQIKDVIIMNPTIALHAGDGTKTNATSPAPMLLTRLWPDRRVQKSLKRGHAEIFLPPRQ